MAAPDEPPRRPAVGGISSTWPPRGAAQAGPFAPAGFLTWTRFVERLRAWARAEAGAGRLLPWVPVAFGTGIALYFTATHEPVLWVAIIAAIGLCVVAALARRHRFFFIAVMCAAVAAGFATATWRTSRVAHVVLAKPLYSVSLSGFVETRVVRLARCHNRPSVPERSPWIRFPLKPQSETRARGR